MILKMLNHNALDILDNKMIDRKNNSTAKKKRKYKTRDLNKIKLSKALGALDVSIRLTNNDKLRNDLNNIKKILIKNADYIFTEN